MQGESLIQKVNWEDVIATMNSQLPRSHSFYSPPTKSIAVEAEDLSMWEELNLTITDWINLLSWVGW